MAVRDDRSDVKQTTTGFRDPRHHICQKQIPIPVLFMSGYTASHLQQADVIDGTVSFISKPFSPGELLERIGELVSEPI